MRSPRTKTKAAPGIPEPASCAFTTGSTIAAISFASSARVPAAELASAPATAEKLSAVRNNAAAIRKERLVIITMLRLSAFDFVSSPSEVFLHQVEGRLLRERRQHEDGVRLVRDD